MSTSPDPETVAAMREIGRVLEESLRLLCLGLAVLLAGSLGTEVLMSQRLEGDGRATYLATSYATDWARECSGQ